MHTPSNIIINYYKRKYEVRAKCSGLGADTGFIRVVSLHAIDDELREGRRVMYWDYELCGYDLK